MKSRQDARTTPSAHDSAGELDNGEASTVPEAAKGCDQSVKTPADRSEGRLQAIQEALSLIDPTRRAAVERKAAQIPLKYRLGHVRAAAGLASPRQAAKAHCLECAGWDPDGVRECTALACPLYPYRPYQGEVADEQ